MMAKASSPRLRIHRIALSQPGVPYVYVGIPQTVTVLRTLTTALSIELIIEYAISTANRIRPWFVWNLTEGEVLCAPVNSGIRTSGPMYARIFIVLSFWAGLAWYGAPCGA